MNVKEKKGSRHCMRHSMRTCCERKWQRRKSTAKGRRREMKEVEAREERSEGTKTRGRRSREEAGKKQGRRERKRSRFGRRNPRLHPLYMSQSKKNKKRGNRWEKRVKYTIALLSFTRRGIHRSFSPAFSTCSSVDDDILSS